MPAWLTHHISSEQALSENFTMGSFRLMSQEQKCGLLNFLRLKLSWKATLLPALVFPSHPPFLAPICSHSISQQGQKLLNICLDTGGAWIRSGYRRAWICLDTWGVCGCVSVCVFVAGVCSLYRAWIWLDTERAWICSLQHPHNQLWLPVLIAHDMMLLYTNALYYIY